MRSEDVYDLLDHDPVAQELLGSAIPARVAYIGLDGAPRVIPIGFVYNGTYLSMFTVPRSAKVAALRENPRVAITIDTDTQPPHVLLLRGQAAVEIVEGVPDEFIESGRKLMEPNQFAQWEPQVRALYDEMARIEVTPTWAKVLDFETRAPKAVMDAAREKGFA